MYEGKKNMITQPSFIENVKNDNRNKPQNHCEMSQIANLT